MKSTKTIGKKGNILGSSELDVSFWDTIMEV